MRSERPRRALIVDPAIHSMGGHHYTAMLRLSSDLDGLSIPHICLGARSAEEEVCAAFDLRRCFSESIYGRSDWTRVEFHRRAQSMARDLARAVRWQWPRPDLLVLPSCDQVLALGLAKALARSAVRWRPRVVLWLLFPPDERGLGAHETDGALLDEYREAFRALKASIGDPARLHVYCETRELATAYADVTEMQVGVQAGPSMITRRRDSRATLPDEPVVACVGHANEAKGYRLLPEAIELALRSNTRVRFMIHGTTSNRDVTRDPETFAALRAMGARVDLKTGVLSPGDYEEHLRSADLLLLPYDPQVYRSRGSGVFNEATLLGKPTIVTAGCGFAEAAFAEGRSVAIENFDSVAIARGILQAVERLESLSSNARAFADKPGADSFVQLLRQFTPAGELLKN